MPRLEFPEIRVFLRMHLREPLDVRHPVPTGNEQAQRRSLMPGQRLAVERPRQERIRRQHLLARHAPAVLLLDGELLRAKLDLFLAAIGAKEDKLARLRLEARSIQDGAQRHARPSAVARQSLQWPPVAGAFETRNELGAADLPEIVERQRQRPEISPVTFSRNAAGSTTG